MLLARVDRYNCRNVLLPPREQSLQRRRQNPKVSSPTKCLHTLGAIVFDFPEKSVQTLFYSVFGHIQKSA